MITLVAATAFFAVAAIQKPKMPDRVFGSGWGVNIHFTREKPNEVKQIAQGGFQWIRMNYYWGYVEENPKNYRFKAYDELLEDLNANGIRPIFTLSFENPNYGSTAPRTPEQRKAFSEYVRASLLHFRGKGIVWELWNEPNYPAFWKPAPNVNEYIELIRSVGETFERTAPDEMLIGPSTSGFDWPFIEAILNSKAHEAFDAFTVHPYRQETPETVIPDYQRLRGLLDKSGAKGSSMPIWCGEWGYSETYRDMNETAQSWMAVRTYLVNLYAGVPLTIHYSWKNEMWQEKEEGRKFGTVDDSLNPKASYKAMKLASNELSGYEYKSRIDTGAHIFALVFKKADQYKIAAWSTTPAGTLRIGGNSYSLTRAPQFIRADLDWFSTSNQRSFSDSTGVKRRRFSSNKPSRKGSL